MFGKVEKSVHDAVVKERDSALETIKTLTGEKETLTGQVTTLTTERDQARTELETAQNALVTAQNTATDLQSKVDDLTAKLAARPGVEATSVAPNEETIETQEEAPTVAADPVTEFASEKM